MYQKKKTNVFDGAYIVIICSVGKTASGVCCRVEWKAERMFWCVGWAGGSPGGPVVKTALPLQGTRVQSLVREVRSHMLGGAANKKRKEVFCLPVSVSPGKKPASGNPAKNILIVNILIINILIVNILIVIFRR